MEPAPERPSWLISEMRAVLRGKVLRWLSGMCLCAALFCVKGCVLSFPDAPEGDLCAASEDAGFQPSTAPDPALRGCDAGPPKDDANQELAGSAGMGGAP